jgi:Flp pilus assembly protein TadG
MRVRDTRSGQALVEMALLLPVLLLLFLGSWTAANLIDDNNAAAQATRAGARLAAELGNGGYPNETEATCQLPANGGVGLTDPCDIDKDIIDQVLPIVSPQLTNAKVIEIDIYQPSGCTGTTPYASGTCPPNNGAYCTSTLQNSYTPVCAGVTELIDKYAVTGLSYSLSGTAAYTLALRDQTHPNESELGVRLVFTYTSPTLRFFTQTDTQYTVMRLAPTA